MTGTVVIFTMNPRRVVLFLLHFIGVSLPYRETSSPLDMTWSSSGEVGSASHRLSAGHKTPRLHGGWAAAQRSTAVW